MRVAFFGTPAFAVPTLERLLESRHEVVLVVSRPDKEVGRRRVLTSPPVVELAREHGLEVIQPAKLRTGGATAELQASGAQVAVVVAYGRIIPEPMLAAVPSGYVNLHPSLLPRHRGPSPMQWALVSGDRVTGVTTMLLDEGMDTGPILLQERVQIEPHDTTATLSERLAPIGADLVVETLNQLEDGTLEPRPQPPDGANVTPMLRRDFGEVEWSMPAKQLVNRLRGFTPWPGLHTTLKGGRLKLLGLEAVTPPPGGDERPGTVLEADARGIVVRCGRGSAVRITELQREGRRQMPADAFLIGERVVKGERLG